MKFSTPVVVIGTRGGLRNPQLTAIEAIAKVHYVAPVFINPKDQNEQLSSPNISELALGRPLTVGEIGCAIAHQRATETVMLVGSDGGDSHSEWALILEDDADGKISDFIEILEFLDSLRIGKPSLINFFSDSTNSTNRNRPSSKCRTRSKFHRQFYWRGITSSYALNLAATELLVGMQTGRVSYVADWPPSYAHLSFFQSRLTLGQSASESVIGSRQILSIPSRMALHFKHLRNCGDLSRHFGVSRISIIKVLILYPIVRDFINRLRALSPKRAPRVFS